MGKYEDEKFTVQCILSLCLLVLEVRKVFVRKGRINGDCSVDNDDDVMWCDDGDDIDDSDDDDVDDDDDDDGEDDDDNDSVVKYVLQILFFADLF